MTYVSKHVDDRGWSDPLSCMNSAVHPEGRLRLVGVTSRDVDCMQRAALVRHADFEELGDRGVLLCQFLQTHTRAHNGQQHKNIDNRACMCVCGRVLDREKGSALNPTTGTALHTKRLKRDRKTTISAANAGPRRVCALCLRLCTVCLYVRGCLLAGRAHRTM